MTPATRHLLVVDDDTELCQLLSEYLLPEGYDVESVHNGMEGVERALSGDHALVVAGRYVARCEGFEVLRQLRARSRMPVLMLTARGNEQDRILGLEMGRGRLPAETVQPARAVRTDRGDPAPFGGRMRRDGSPHVWRSAPSMMSRSIRRPAWFADEGKQWN